MAPHPEIVADALSPMAVNALQQAKSLAKREDPYRQLASAGAKPPLDLAGPGFQALFALIGIGMAFMAIWFFFWAKNGGFKWREGDWEDYKSTVLRRKGPDGKTLSNATKSTRLGGGSVVHGGSYFGAQSDLGYTDESGTTVTSSTYTDAEKGEAGLRGGDGRKHKKHRRNHTNDYNDPELRQYREEKAARVGGLNRVGDGKYTDYSGSQPSEVGGSQVSSNVPLVKKEPKEPKEPKDPKKEAKAKEQRAKERMRKAKAAEKEAAKKEAAEAKARKEEQKAEAKRLKDEQKRSRKNGAPSEAPEMAEVSRPMIEYHPAESEYTRAYTEYTAPSVVDTTPTRAPTRTSKGPNGPRRAPPSAAYSFTTGDDTETVYTGVNTNDPDSPPAKAPAKTSRTAPTEVTESSYYSDYRPNADPSLYTDPNKHAPRSRSARPSTDRGDRSSRSARPSSSSRPRPSGSRSRPPSESPRKQHRSSRPAPPPSDIFTTANGDAHGHMSYPCHIPGLSQAGSVHPMESVSQVGVPTNRRERGGRDVMDGYRRGGVRAVGRRDSLSDSD